MWSRPTSSALLVPVLVLLALTSCGERNPEDRSGDLEDRLEKLKSVPYTSMTSEKVSADTSGVMLYDRDRAWPGYNLYCSRMTPEAFLLDMEGNVVHRWTHEFKDGFVWDYAIMLENGDLIVLDKFHYIFQLDWDSNLLWERRLSVHHDVAKADDGTLFVIELTTRRHRGLLVRFTSIMQLDETGELLRRWSSYEHLDELKAVLDTTPFLDTVLDLREASGQGGEPDTVRRPAFGPDAGKKRKKKLPYDYFHINTVTILPETPLGMTDYRFAPGNLLICLRNVDQIATINWDTGKVLWGWGAGILEHPHHPTMLPNGHILIFDNGVRRKASKVLEIEPASGEIFWEYTANPPGSFYSPQKGSAQRLPNGNTLICEGDKGRTFEVTKEGEIVWEWYNPLIKDERRVQVYRMIRIPADLVESLMAREGK